MSVWSTCVTSTPCRGSHSVRRVQRRGVVRGLRDDVIAGALARLARGGVHPMAGDLRQRWGELERVSQRLGTILKKVTCFHRLSRPCFLIHGGSEFWTLRGAIDDGRETYGACQNLTRPVAAPSGS